MLSNIVLPIFFLYFVLISEYCSSLLNCGLQRYMKHSIYFKHILIFLSIYIFTFILGWYRFESLVIGIKEDFTVKENEKTKKEFNKKPLKKLGTWLLYTIAIYIIFLISTKSEVVYIITFFVFTIISIIIQIILKSISSSEYSQINNKFFISSKDYKGDNDKLVVILHNAISTGFIIVLALLLLGFFQYFNRQYADHAHHWDTRLFIFGTSTCRDI